MATPYEVRWARKAQRELAALERDARDRILAGTRELAMNPRPLGCKNLRGAWRGHYRVRFGDYRVLYTVDDAVRIVDVVHVGDRKDVY
ncbi:MAG: type II toxin-antitoxin system RelE/ParE family toxin [Myxococcota bacterium]|nr:type II toxin-antitoxin system RelE/ParE family toxin [Myxococcota bacterium]